MEDFVVTLLNSDQVNAMMSWLAEYSVLTILSRVAIGLILLVLLAQSPLYPLYLLYTLPQQEFSSVTPSSRRSARGVFLRSWSRSLLAIIPDLLAPIVVPIALLFTSWEDKRLPGLFQWWDNDASINGDLRTDDPNDGLDGWALWQVPLDRDNEEAIRRCYWAEGHHPRSFFARWVWLGLRNRASYLNVAFGKPFGYMIQSVSRTTSINDHLEFREGVSMAGSRMASLKSVKPLGPFVIRSYYGYKIPNLPGEPVAKIATVGFSMKRKYLQP